MADLSLINNGYTVIEEAIAQEVSEELIYSVQNRPRPLPNYHKDPAIPNVTYQSNYDFYGLYQPIGIQFAKTLRGIGNKKQPRDTAQSVYLHGLCQRAFNDNFIVNIFREYEADGHWATLIKTFKNLGSVHNVKQATFGVNNGVALTERNLRASSENYLNVIDTYRELEDHRSPRNDIDI